MINKQLNRWQNFIIYFYVIGLIRLNNLMVRTGRKAFGWHEEEPLNNTIKHARASLLLVEINQNHKFIALAVKDDGKGFDTQKVEINNRGGLGNMRERIKMLDGIFQKTSHPGIGTAVLFHIPLNFGSVEK